VLAVAVYYFQGREKDVVIFSCVRTAGVHHRSIGFVADERRINVGITRARCALLIIGHAASLAVDERWRNLVKSAVERKVMFQPEKPYNDYMQQVRLLSAMQPILNSGAADRYTSFAGGPHRGSPMFLHLSINPDMQQLR
jgi:hypothetical protein